MNNRKVCIGKKWGQYSGFSRINGVKLHYFQMDDGQIIKRFGFHDVETLDGKPLKQIEKDKVN